MSKTSRGGDFRLNSDISIAIGLRKCFRNIGLTNLSTSNIGLPKVRQLLDWLKSMEPKKEIFRRSDEFFSNFREKYCFWHLWHPSRAWCMLPFSLLLLTPTDSGGLAAVDNAAAVISVVCLPACSCWLHYFWKCPCFCWRPYCVSNILPFAFFYRHCCCLLASWKKVADSTWHYFQFFKQVSW